MACISSAPGVANHFEVGAFLKCSADAVWPDLQRSLLALALAPGTAQGTMEFGRHGFRTPAVLLRPFSRWSLRLKSPDPVDAPAIRMIDLSDDADTVRLRAGIETARNIRAQPVHAEFAGPEVSPGADLQKDEAPDDCQQCRIFRPELRCKCGPGMRMTSDRRDDPIGPSLLSAAWCRGSGFGHPAGVGIDGLGMGLAFLRLRLRRSKATAV